ncbi:S-adenosyl-L-methionine-dependent methyltransferase [Aspergillus leporis]|jgi:FkbM family methyltransferase|uniref:S-adenosyl-L-methionine-dependent methyltransferase n=1 Tax=Aspergillus leporis TaxID=41062 RepID=A0A5N5WNZ7_9EURO|nr:S-adenosyl-L-methionine-dependent methyltransferase [Aspergillus leporis]
MTLQLVKMTDSFSCYARGEFEARFIYNEIFESHEYDGPELPEAPFIVDAGANIGLFSLYMKEKYPLAKIIAFEPAPESFDALNRNLALHNATGVVPYPYALGSQAYSATFTYYPNAPGNSTLNLKEKELHQRLIKENYSEMPTDEVWKDSTQFPVPVNRLSHFLNCYHSDIATIDLLKIDVEGTELDVLGGVDDKHWDNIQNVVLEVSDVCGSLDKVKQLLQSKGFTVTCVAAGDAKEIIMLYMVTACR